MKSLLTVLFGWGYAFDGKFGSELAVIAKHLVNDRSIRLPLDLVPLFLGPRWSGSVVNILIGHHSQLTFGSKGLDSHDAEFVALRVSKHHVVESALMNVPLHDDCIFPMSTTPSVGWPRRTRGLPTRSGQAKPDRMRRVWCWSSSPER